MPRAAPPSVITLNAAPTLQLLQTSDAGSRQRMLTALQGAAGNAAVQRMMTAPGPPRRRPVRKPIRVQRCGPKACDCPAEERLENAVPDTPVQRDFLSDAAAAVLPSWVNNAIFGEKGKAEAEAEAKAREAPGKVEDAEREITGDEAKESTGLEKTQGTVEQQGTKADQALTKEGSASEQAGAKVSQDAEHRSNELPKMAGDAEPLLSPAKVAIGESTAVAAESKVAETAAKAGGAAAAGITKDVTKTADVAKGKWNCPTTDIGAIVDGIPGKVLRGAAGVVSKATGIPVDDIIAFGNDVAKGIKGVATKVGNKIKGVGEAIKEAVGPTVDAINKKVEGVGQAISKGIDAAKQAASEEFERRKKNFTERVGKIADKGKALLDKIGKGLRDKGPGVIEKIKAKVSAFWTALPAPLKGVIMGLGAPFIAAAAGIAKYGPQLLDLAGKAKDRFVKFAKAKADAALKKLAERRKQAAEWRANLKKKLAAGWKKIKDAIPEKWKKGASDLAAAAKKKVDGYKKAAVDVAKKKAGEVCAAVGDEAEACATQYLPNLGEGNKSSLKLTAAAELVVPLHELGVPANLKVGKGAIVEVIRVGSGQVGKDGAGPNDGGKSFQVAITGDAALYLNEGVGEANDAKINVDTPGLGPKVKALSWDKLKGGSGMPGMAKMGSGQTGTKADADLGIRGQSQLTYGFTAGKTNCSGLGGVVALLGAMGCSAALPQSWGIVGDAMIEEVFSDNLVSKKFTVASGVQVSGEVANDAIGKLSGKAGAEVSTSAGVTYETDEKTGERKEKSTLEVGGKIFGEGAAEIDNGVISGVSVGGSASAGVNLGLAYDPVIDGINVNSVRGDVELGLARAGFNPANFMRLLGVDGVALLGDKLKYFEGDSGSLKAAASIQVDNVNDLTNALDAHFMNPDQVSVDSTVALARKKFKELPKTATYSVTITNATRLAGVSGEAEERKDGMTLGAKGSVSLDKVDERMLVSGTRKFT
ncbi:MAG TPA: hypothetical protein VM345_14030 [Acidimicrobiales bacterium]|nr:hypothetical protein [Acidimicrobiales bacterium]